MLRRHWKEQQKSSYEDKCITIVLSVDKFKNKNKVSTAFPKMGGAFFMPKRRLIRWINFGDGW